MGILGTSSLEKRLRAIEKTLHLEYQAAQQKRALCALPSHSQQCNGIAACQMIDCCQHDVVPAVEESSNSSHSMMENSLD